MALPGGLHLRLISGGPPAGTPVLLVHGWGIHAYLWRRTLPALTNAGFRAYAIDLPGHGLSDRPLTPGTYTLASMTQAIADVIAALGLERPHLVAQSMGGRIAMELVKDHPERARSLVLFGSVGFGTVPRAVKLAPLLPPPSTHMIRRWMVELGEAFVYGKRAKVDPSFVDAYWAQTQFPDFLAAVRQSLIEFDWRPVTAEFLSRITIPTLVFFGTRDRTVRPVYAEQLVPSLPDGRLYRVKDAGHVVNEEAYDEITPVMLEFIAGHT